MPLDLIYKKLIFNPDRNLSGLEFILKPSEPERGIQKDRRLFKINVLCADIDRRSRTCFFAIPPYI